MRSNSITQEKLSKTHRLGDGTRFEAVRHGIDPERRWLDNEPICEELALYQIVHAGIFAAVYPFNMTRPRQSGTFYLATLEGQGEILIDGSWHRIAGGQCCLFPPHHPNSFRAIADARVWSFAWVRYQEPEKMVPIATANRSVIADCDVNGPVYAIRGLISACRTDESTAIRQLWVSLINSYVQGAANATQYDKRVWRAWRIVSSKLDASWTATTMAQLLHVSPEYFRRLCLKHLGRSPMKHLTFLRIQAATHLLQETDASVEAIAFDVGYNTVAAFSKAFRRWTGHAPSDLRRRSAP